MFGMEHGWTAVCVLSMSVYAGVPKFDSRLDLNFYCWMLANSTAVDQIGVSNPSFCMRNTRYIHIGYNFCWSFVTARPQIPCWNGFYYPESLGTFLFETEKKECLENSPIWLNFCYYKQPHIQWNLIIMQMLGFKVWTRTISETAPFCPKLDSKWREYRLRLRFLMTLGPWVFCAIDRWA